MKLKQLIHKGKIIALAGLLTAGCATQKSIYDDYQAFPELLDAKITEVPNVQLGVGVQTNTYFAPERIQSDILVGATPVLTGSLGHLTFQVGLPTEKEKLIPIIKDEYEKILYVGKVDLDVTGDQFTENEFLYNRSTTDLAYTIKGTPPIGIGTRFWITNKFNNKTPEIGIELLGSWQKADITQTTTVDHQTYLGAESEIKFSAVGEYPDYWLWSQYQDNPRFPTEELLQQIGYTPKEREITTIENEVHKLSLGLGVEINNFDFPVSITPYMGANLYIIDGTFQNKATFNAGIKINFTINKKEKKKFID